MEKINDKIIKTCAILKVLLMDNISIIENFIQSDNITINIGLLDYKNRRLMNDLCRDHRLHTFSVHHHYDANNEPVKELIISKDPFKITDPQTCISIINELKFILDVKIYDSVDDIMNQGSDKIKLKVSEFLNQFSFDYSNNYGRLFAHRKEVINNVRIHLNTVTIPDCPDIISKINSNKRFFIPNNSGSKFVRFDMKSAVTSVIGIRDWESFMRQFTNIELYITSKPLRGYIMRDIHTQCMKLVKHQLYQFIDKLQLSTKFTYLYINADEVIIDFIPDIDYNTILNIIDPDHYFRLEIFELLYVNTGYIEKYIEKHTDGVNKLKAKSSKKL